MSLGKARFNVKGVTEERQFTNPHVRFRRIRGKIVPIFNKKRIGQEVSSLGESAAVKGSAIAGLTLLLKKTKRGKALSSLVSKFNVKSPAALSLKATDSFKIKGVKKSVKLSGKLLKSSFKHSGKIGVGLTAIGAALKLSGDEIQARSPFGKDYFFIKGKDGLGS